VNTLAAAAIVVAQLHAGPVVMIGDSITRYWDDPTWQSSRADLISAHVRNVIDVGIGGQTCSQMLERFETDVLSRHPSVIYIECGTNDVARNHSTDTGPLFEMVERAQASGAEVIVGNLPPCEPRAYVVVHDDQPLFAFWRRAIVQGAKTYGYKLANYYPELVLPDGQQNFTLFSSDKVHPNSKGYAIMWGVLRPLLPSSDIQ
jgi:lysophospholipase L1-like esterase